VVVQTQRVQFIIDEILQRRKGAANAACHRFGCRIVQRLLELCPSAQVQRLVDDLLGDAIAVSSDQYGNFVMQHVLKHGGPERARWLCEAFAERDNVKKVCSSKYACSVLSTALDHAPSQTLLASAFQSVAYDKDGPMSKTMSGRNAVRKILKNMKHAQSGETQCQSGCDGQPFQVAGRGRRHYSFEQRISKG
jgi:hypothetical protein